MLRLKKAIKLAVSVGLLSLFLVSNLCLGQKKISGIYQKKQPSVEGYVSYSFAGDGKVRFEKGLNPDQIVFSEGSYVLSDDDTLTLNFPSVKTSDSGNFTVESKRLTAGVSSLSITIFDLRDSSRIALVPVLHLLDSAGNELTSVHTDANGSINLDMKPKLITKLVFRFLGYDTLTLEMARFLNHSAHLSIYLCPSTEIELQMSSIKYHLKKVGDYIVLTSIDGVSSKFTKQELNR